MSFARDTHSLMLQAQYMQKGMWEKRRSRPGSLPLRLTS